MTDHDAPAPAPVDHQAYERAVIATALAHPRPDVIDDITDTGLMPWHFSAERHTAAWNAIVDLRHTGAGPDPLAVAAHIPPADLARYGGLPWLATLTVDDQTTPAAATAHARRVREHHDRRALATAGRRITAAAESPAPLDHALAAAARHLADVQDAHDGTTPDDDTAATAVDAALTAMNAPDRSVPTGWHDLDAILDGGLAPGTLTVIGARPAVGKTAVLLDLAQRAAVTDGRHVLYVTCEMRPSDLVTRVISARSGIPYEAIRAHNRRPLDPGALARVHAAADAVRTSRLIIPAGAAPTVEQIHATVRRHARTAPVDLVLVDYLQILTATPGVGTESRRVAVDHMSGSLKRLALDLDTTVVCAAQLNRESARADRAPVMSDLRESGSIEQDADILALLHRQVSAPADGGTWDPTRLRILVQKNRRGRTGTAELLFDLSRQRILNPA